MAICNFYDSAVIAGSGNGVPQGIFIPPSDLPGFNGSEFTDTSEITKEGKAIYALLNAVYKNTATTPPLGFASIAKSNPQGTGVNQSTESISLTFQWIQDLSNKTTYAPPLPTIGTNAGFGGCSLEQIFPDCLKIANEGAIPGAGILLLASDIALYGGSHPSTISVDARDWIAGLFGLLIANATLRTTSIASAITNKTNALTTKVNGLQFPASWYDANSPLTGLLAGDIPHYRIIQDSFSITYEYINDPIAQTFEVRVATA
jgi:hypothetical protein